MTGWLTPTILLVLLVLALNVATRAIEASTGRATTADGLWRLVVPLGTAGAVLGAAALLDLPLPWLAFSAGLSAGVLGLLVQPVAGRRAA